ncbi:MAG: hypothetical protein LBS53_11270 [Synergistaceae bacterium]|nr:hypothetical protein [Synergistaceae bacterium]
MAQFLSFLFPWDINVIVNDLSLPVLAIEIENERLVNPCRAEHDNPEESQPALVHIEQAVILVTGERTTNSLCRVTLNITF